MTLCRSPAICRYRSSKRAYAPRIFTPIRAQWNLPGLLGLALTPRAQWNLPGLLGLALTPRAQWNLPGLLGFGLALTPRRCLPLASPSRSSRRMEASRWKSYASRSKLFGSLSPNHASLFGAIFHPRHQIIYECAVSSVGAMKCWGYSEFVYSGDITAIGFELFVR